MSLATSLSIITFIFGAVVGSFLNVCIYRLPLNQSVVSPGSRCMGCGKSIRWYDNIPVLGWLFLKGRCRSCGASFSVRYPLVELLNAILSLLLFLKFGMTLQYGIMFVFCSALVVITFIDIDHQIIPDEISLPGIVIGFAASFFIPSQDWLSSLLGIIAGWGILAAIFYGYLWLTGREGMGGGDAKLLAMMGAFLGIKSILFIIFVSSLAGTIAGLSLMAARGKDRHLAIPFGPYLALGALLYIFAGPQIISWYLRIGS